MEQAYNEQAVELRGHIELNQELTDRLAVIEATQECIVTQEEERRKNRVAQYAKRQSMDTEKFIKVFPKGVCDMKEHKDVKDISFADAGKLMFLSMHIQKDTGLIANDNGSPMNITQMAKAIGDNRQNFHKTLRLFIEMNFVRNVGSEYFVNPEYAFNGVNRSKVVQLFFNECNNVTINIDQRSIGKLS